MHRHPTQPYQNATDKPQFLPTHGYLSGIFSATHTSSQVAAGATQQIVLENSFVLFFFINFVNVCTEGQWRSEDSFTGVGSLLPHGVSEFKLRVSGL